MTKHVRLIMIFSALLFGLGGTSKVWAKKSTSHKKGQAGAAAKQSLVHVTIVPVDSEQKDATGNPVIVSGKMSAFILDQRTGKSYEGPTPFSVSLPSGGLFSVTLRAPSIEELAKNPAAAYVDGFKANLQMTPALEGQLVTIEVKRKSNRPNVSVITTGTVPTPSVPTAPVPGTPIVPIPAVSGPSLTLPAGKALLLIGVDSTQLAPMENVRCIVNEKVGDKNIDREMECTQFFSPRGIQVNSGKAAVVLKSPSYTVREDLQLQSGQIQSVTLKLSGRLKLETKQTSAVPGVSIQVDSGPKSDNITLPFSTDLTSGLHLTKATKEGYFSSSAWTLVEPFGTNSVPVIFNANPEAQGFLCGLCAKTRGKFRLTTEFTIGPPDWFLAQFMLGIAEFNKHLKLDLGIRISTSYYLTVAGALAHVQLVTAGPFTLAGRLFLGGGGGPRGAINQITFEIGPLMSVDVSKRIQFFLFPYFQMYQDVLPSPADGIPPRDLSLNYRFILKGGFEFNLSRFVNLGLSVSWAPGTSRDMFTSTYGKFIYPEADNAAAGGLYAAISMIVKWPAFSRKIQ